MVAKYDFLTAVLFKIQVFLNGNLFRWASEFRRFGRCYSLFFPVLKHPKQSNR